MMTDGGRPVRGARYEKWPVMLTALAQRIILTRVNCYARASIDWAVSSTVLSVKVSGNTRHTRTEYSNCHCEPITWDRVIGRSVIGYVCSVLYGL